MKEIILNQYLSSLCKDELQKEIVQLSKLCPEVKEYYNLKISNKLEETLLEQYKKRIEEEFLFNESSNKVKYSVVSEIIMEFQQISNMPGKIVELMIYYLNKALELINSKRCVEEKFYLSVEGVFEKALNILFKNKLEEEFQEHIKEIIEKINKEEFELKESMMSIYFSYY